MWQLEVFFLNILTNNIRLIAREGLEKVYSLRFPPDVIKVRLSAPNLDEWRLYGYFYTVTNPYAFSNTAPITVDNTLPRITATDDDIIRPIG